MSDAACMADADFTPNPERSVWIYGEIDRALLERIRPKVLELTSASREPITVFIESEGGKTKVAEEILRLLRSTSEDGDKQPCPLITVASKKAESAAAFILAAGDHAIAPPDTKLLYHSTHISLPYPVTERWGRLVLESLQKSNREHAIALAECVAPRLGFLLLALQLTFEECRKNAGSCEMSDLQCLIAAIRPNVSLGAQRILDRAASHAEDDERLFLRFQWAGVDGLELSYDDDASSRLRCLFRKDGDFVIGPGKGLREVSDRLFIEDPKCQKAARDFFRRRDPLADGDSVELSDFLPFWRLSLSLSDALNDGENVLTPIDALWFGLVDTVREAP